MGHSRATWTKTANSLTVAVRTICGSRNMISRLTVSIKLVPANAPSTGWRLPPVAYTSVTHSVISDPVIRHWITRIPNFNNQDPHRVINGIFFLKLGRKLFTSILSSHGSCGWSTTNGINKANQSEGVLYILS